MTVRDDTNLAAGSAYFAALRSKLAGAKPIGGGANFGFPAFSTPNGNVAFLKDGKTLLVDASGLPDDVVPSDFTRLDAAYSAAAAVIECWTE